MESSSEKAEVHACFLTTTREVGLELASEKCIPPTQSLIWLGFQIDTVHMVVNLPHDKVEEVLNECRVWKGKSSASRKQIQSLAGKLQHLAKCVKPATRFMNRVLCALRASPPTGQHPFSPSLLKDLDWFIQITADLNKVVLLPSAPPPNWVIECDSTLPGACAVSPSSYYAVSNPPEVKREARVNHTPRGLLT